MPSAVTVAALSAEEARALTDRIRSTAENLCDLLSQAHEGQAFRALGYASWVEYVGAEFSMSRTHSYRLLAQARVIETLGEAAGGESVTHGLQIPERTAREIAPRLPFVVDDIQERVAGGQEPRAAVREAVESARTEVQAKRNGKAHAPPLIEPEPEDEHAPDPIAEWERAEAENEVLRAQVESLSASDLGAEVLSWQRKFGALNGRLDLAIRQKNEAEKTARYQSGVLATVRKLLKVDANSEIEGALRDILR